jgi:hypothetical protein
VHFNFQITITLDASADVTASVLKAGSYQSIVDFVRLHGESASMSEEEIPSIWTKSLIMVKRNSKGGKWKDELDPKAIIYRKSGRDRRKADDPFYKGPERRLGKRREKELYNIIGQLEKESKRK